MTNKTEMVSVRRDLLERVSKGDASRNASAQELLDAWVAMGEIIALLAAPAAESPEPVDEPRLTNKAKVGSVIFSEGVKESAVIQCAQRAYEFSQQPEEEAERVERLKETLTQIHGVRPSAVVDEPVAWMVAISGTNQFFASKREAEKERAEYESDMSAADIEEFSVPAVPLYRHPPRPIVMPECIERVSDFEGGQRSRGWNACLDEFARLNK